MQVCGVRGGSTLPQAGGTEVRPEARGCEPVNPVDIRPENCALQRHTRDSIPFCKGPVSKKSMHTYYLGRISKPPPPVRSSRAGGKAQESSRPPRSSDVLRAGTARAPVGVSGCILLSANRPRCYWVRNFKEPNCVCIVRKSKLFQASMILPFFTRAMHIPVKAISFSVALNPRPSPSCLPRTTQRAAI